jgi:hypothetical protein
MRNQITIVAKSRLAAPTKEEHKKKQKNKKQKTRAQA